MTHENLVLIVCSTWGTILYFMHVFFFILLFSSENSLYWKHAIFLYLYLTQELVRNLVLLVSIPDFLQVFLILRVARENLWCLQAIRTGREFFAHFIFHVRPDSGLYEYSFHPLIKLPYQWNRILGKIWGNILLFTIRFLLLFFSSFYKMWYIFLLLFSLAHATNQIANGIRCDMEMPLPYRGSVCSPVAERFICK